MSHISTFWDSSFRQLLLTLTIATDVYLEDRHPHLLDFVTTGRCHTTHRAHLHHQGLATFYMAEDREKDAKELLEHDDETVKLGAARGLANAYRAAGREADAQALKEHPKLAS